MGWTNILYFIFYLVILNQQGISGDEIRLDQSPAVIKRLQERVKISCKISGFTMTSYWMHWIRQKPGKALEWIGRVNSGSSVYADSMKDHFTLTEDVSADTQYLEAKSLREEDTAVYYCARDNWGLGHYFDYWGKGTQVTVSSAQPSAPQSIFGLSQCESDTDGFLTIGCMARGFSPADSLTFKWTNPAGQPVNDFVQYPAFTQGGDNTKVSYLRVEKSDWDANKRYKCEAENSAGKKDTSPAPRVPPPDQSASVHLTTPSKAELDSGTATFICLAKQFYPESHSFKWFQDGQEVENVIADECVAKKKTNVTLYTATSVLQRNADIWTQRPGTKIKCVFGHKTGNETRVAENTVSSTDTHVTAQFIPPSWEDMLKNRGGNLKCKASGETGFKRMEIKASGHSISTSSEDNLKEKTTVELEARISFEEWSNGTEFLCSVEHESTAKPTEISYVRQSGEDTKRPSVYILAPPEQQMSETVTLTCYVKNFYPLEVFVSWLADDEPLKVDDGYMQNTSMPMLNNNYYSAYSQLTFPSVRWQIGTVFSCLVYHESIDESLKVLTRSITSNLDKPNTFNLSLNTCKSLTI